MRAKLISKDIVITIPYTIDWEDYSKELDKVKDWKYVLNFKVPNFPAHSGKGAKCYLNYRGNLIGWMEIVGFSEEEFTSEVIYISFTPVSGQTSTVYEIRFKLVNNDNQDLKYRLGMDGDAVISLRKVENALTIPIESLHQENDQIYVFVKENNNTNMSKKYVKTGIETDAFVEILEGLSENDQIVISK